MGKHHTEDYKLSAVKYALRTDNQVETCEVFELKFFRHCNTLWDLI